MFSYRCYLESLAEFISHLIAHPNLLKTRKKSEKITKNFSSSSLLQVESVELALNVLDGSDIRGKQIKVQRAQFEMKGDYNPALKPKTRKADKQKIKKMQEK